MNDVEDESRKLFERLMTLFDRMMKIDNHHKGYEPHITIAYEISNEYPPEARWFCEIYSYAIHMCDDEGCGKRHYRWEAESFEELGVKVERAVTVAEREFEEWREQYEREQEEGELC